jgi:hypothetical protein
MTMFNVIAWAIVVAGAIIVALTNQWWVVLPVAAAVGICVFAKRLIEKSPDPPQGGSP